MSDPNLIDENNLEIDVCSYEQLAEEELEENEDSVYNVYQNLASFDDPDGIDNW